MSAFSKRDSSPIYRPVFYGWWIVLAAFLNLFFSVGTIYYGFPVFYPSLIAELGLSRSQVTQGFLLGFLIVGIPGGFAAGSLIDRFGARRIILIGIGLVGLPLILMGFMHRLWQYETLSVAEVLGYVLAGPIPNQVLIARWFRVHRGRAMGFAYLGLGLGGVVTPPAADWLIRHIGWRATLECLGAFILLALLPVGLFITRSSPKDMNLLPDGDTSQDAEFAAAPPFHGATLLQAVRTRNFWLLLIGSTLVMGSINTIVQHFVLFLRDQGYTPTSAAHEFSILLAASLCGRVAVGYVADRYHKKNTMALFYLLIGASIPLLFLARHPAAAVGFSVIFGVAMGADYMLIPLVAADCFGISVLGKLLALLIMGYSVGQWLAPWLAGRIFDVTGSYRAVWGLAAGMAIAGACIIYFILPVAGFSLHPTLRNEA
jgi:MFS family permease